MTSVLMVEDEFMVAKRLSRFIHLAFDKQALKFKHCVSLEDAQDYLASNSVDVLFLDLNLQGLDGFTLLKQQLCESFHTIVVSANSDRAIEAFDLGVLDFVAKPFTQQRIQKAVDRLGQIANTHIKFLPYKHLGNIELLPIEQIHYIKADGHYSLVNSGANKEILHDKSIDKLMAILPECFIRVHRSYIVNINLIQSIGSEPGSKYFVTLVHEQVIPVGRTRVSDLRLKLNIE